MTIFSSLDEAARATGQAAVVGARPSTTSGAPLVSGLGPNSTYSGCDIKLVVHFPSGQDADEADEEYAQELETEGRAQEQIVRSYFPDYVVSNGEDPPTPDLSGLSARDRERVQTALDGLRAVRRDQTQPRPGRVTTVTKVLAELQTISVGVYRTKLPVRNLGATYVKSYARGTLTISGSMIFTVFNRNVWTEILETFNDSRDYAYRDRDPYNFLTVVPHQLPPMDISIVFANELGNVSYMAIYGVEILNEGLVMSVNDLHQEGNYTYVARDISLMSDATVASRSEGGSEGLLTGSQLSDLDPRYAETLRDIRDNPYR